MTMTDQYFCEDAERRLEATRDGGTLNGIDTLEVDGGHTLVIDDVKLDVPAQRTLLVRCLLALPKGLGAADVAVSGGVRVDPNINPVRVLWALPASELQAAHQADPASVTEQDAAVFAKFSEPDHLLVVRTSSAGDFSTYRFVILDPGAHTFDPRLAEAEFSFKVDCSNEFDCRVPQVCPPERIAEPVIDYLSRDYAGLRQLLLDRLSLILPQWTDRNAADVGVALVELFAYLGDYLAYAQDAVSAEAYLGTARRRVSVARHARMLDYPMHNGAAARTWLVIEADSGADRTVLPAGREVRAADGSGVFHTLHDVSLGAARNEIDFYTWSGLHCCLPRGATRATLCGTSASLGLKAGDVLVFEEIRGNSGFEVDADPTHRCAVRLVADPQATKDPLTGTDVLEVSWHDEDELPFPLCVQRFSQGRCQPTVGAAVARGNVVLAEHGALVGPERLIPATVPQRGRYRPALDRTGLAHAVPYDHTQARKRPAGESLAVNPQAALPDVVALTNGTDIWTVRRDLLGSDRFAPEFVVEMEDSGRAYLRFGDGVLGRRPAYVDTFQVTYRVGGGRVGNVGRDALTELADPVPGVSVRNPMPAYGGADPEPVEQVRQWAPQAFRVQERAVNDADYAALTQRHPHVQRAAATKRWTGSWYTEFVTIDRSRGAEVDSKFRVGVAEFLERYRMAGEDVEIDGPIFVPLDIVLTVCVQPGYFRSNVKRALLELFSARDLPDGRRGFFHPDNFTFAQPVYLSQVVAAAMSADGVNWVDTEEGPGKRNQFKRWGRPARGERATGRITIGRLEVARCDSDPSRPENGLIDFVMEGGL
ncbi:MAG: putative baseplate assembly protein [Pseudonocardiaceae bacterium]